MLLLSLLLGLQSLGAQNDLRRDTQRLQREGMVGISQVKEMRIHLARQELAVYKAMNARGRVGRDEAMGQLDLARLQLQAALEASRPTLYLAENLERLREFESRLARINRISEEALTLSRNQDQETAQALIDNDSFRQLAGEADQYLADIESLKEATVRETLTRFGHVADRRNWLTFGLLGGGLALALLLSWLISRSIRLPILRVRGGSTSWPCLPPEPGHSAHRLQERDGRPGARHRSAAGRIAPARNAALGQIAGSGDAGRAAAAGHAVRGRAAFPEPGGALAQGLSHALLYTRDDPAAPLTLGASYAIDAAHPPPAELIAGSGLLGQCALDLQPRSISDVLRPTTGRSRPSWARPRRCMCKCSPWCMRAA
ncbi:MCP four helix bundle domain-containing protein [Massilia sp. H-1]|nr:MCP four helix bundle domain-containing protein [Massilia sp. H-1]